MIPINAFDLPVLPLTFTCEAQTHLTLGANAGAQIRGALWQGLRDIVGAAGGEYHPLTRLMSLEADTGRGENPARPLVIRPPLAPRAEQDRRYKTGELFQFGINLCGDAADYFPYVVQAVHRIGQEGIGYGRGQFILKRVMQTGADSASLDLLDGGKVHRPQAALTQQDILKRIEPLKPDRLRLRFLTPTQIVKEKRQFAQIPDFASLIARLIDRCQSLHDLYLPDGEDSRIPQPLWRDAYLTLTAQAQAVRVVQDNTRWIKVRSGSRRTGESTPIGGFVGEVLFEGDLSPFLIWLAWGELLHVGKNAVKGNGWYEIVS